MKMQFFKPLKLSLIALGLSACVNLWALPGTAANSNSTGKNAASTQDSTNSLIQWLNANLVTGTPMKFQDSMKGNWQTLLANHGMTSLNWLVTRKFTYSLLKNDEQKTQYEDLVPTTEDKPEVINKKLPQFNIGSLLSSNSITPNSQEDKDAQILLQFVSGLGNAVSGLPATSLHRGLGPTDEFQKQFGVYVAQQSVGMNILYGFINERLVKKGLGSQLGGPQKDMSPLGLDEFLATRRLNVNDPKGWLSQISTATPAQVAKEQLMLMAEMRYEQYLTRRSLDNLTMLMAVQQLQMTQASAEKLKELKDEVVSASAS